MLTLEAPRTHEARLRGPIVDIRGPSVTIADLEGARDQELLRQIGLGDTDAFRSLFARYAPGANALATRILRHGPLAEEAVQEAFFEVWRTPERYEGRRGSVRGWLMTLVHNRAVDMVRREESQRRRAEQAQAENVVEDHAVVVAEQASLPQERAAVRAALDGLPDAQRGVLDLMYFEGMTQTQVAERLGIPLGTVKSRSLLAMKKLRLELVREDP